MNLDYSFVFCSGVIRTALGPGDMDREQREHYQVVIEAKDMGGQRGGLTGSTVVKITLTDVNDNPPHFTQSKTAAQTKHSVYTSDETHTAINYTQFSFISNQQQQLSQGSLYCKVKENNTRKQYKEKRENPNNHMTSFELALW